MDVTATAAVVNSRKDGEVLAEALPESVKNMLLVLHSNVRRATKAFAGVGFVLG